MVADGFVVDMIMLDFSKIFDVVSHRYSFTGQVEEYRCLCGVVELDLEISLRC